MLVCCKYRCLFVYTAAWSTQSAPCRTVYVVLLPTPACHSNFWFALPVHAPTFTALPPATCKHLPSMTLVIVPLLFRFQAPLQSQALLQLFGSGLQPQSEEHTFGS